MFRRIFPVVLSLAAVAAAQTLPDLTITAFNTAGMSTDTQSLQVSGLVSVTVKNAGGSAVSTPFTVFLFEDRNQNSTYDATGGDVALGQATVPGPLAANAETPVLVPVSGTVLFRGNIITGIVDNGRSITEGNEANNTGRSSGQAVLAPVGQLNPIVKWSKTSFTADPASRNILVAPAVIDLDRDGFPEVVFVTMASNDGGGCTTPGVLRAIDGRTGQEKWSQTDPRYQVAGCASVAVGDIDSDGFPEIVTVSQPDFRFVAFEHTGAFKWFGPQLGSGEALSTPALADLDADGRVEVIIASTVANPDGTLRWKGAAGTGRDGFGAISIAVDLDLDGRLELVTGSTAYRADGSIYWNPGMADGLTAVANFDTDPNPEIVVVSNGTVRLLEHNGTLKWGPVSIPGGGGGPPTVADFDGDGQPEIGVAGGTRYAVFETDGTLKWQAETRDTSSFRTGSSVFDFEADGKAEVVYADELKFRIYEGTSGRVLYELPNSSCTAFEYPVVADVDGDGRADVVVVANTTCGFGPDAGLRLISGEFNNWAPTRKIWNQHSYSITNVNDDGTIPRTPQNNWQVPGLNNFRLNTFSQPQASRGAPDYTSSVIRKNDSTFPATVRLTARVGNGGAGSLGAPTAVARVFNTGVDDSGRPIAQGAVDPHYRIIAGPGVTSPANAVTTASGFWVGNSDTSQWISSSPGGGGAIGDYTYRTTTDLTGYDPSTVVLTGRWSTDNNGTDIKVNGTSTGSQTAFDAFRGWTNFEIRTGFIAGLNNIDFSYYEGGFIHGLRVEISMTASRTSSTSLGPNIVQNGGFESGVNGTTCLTPVTRIDAGSALANSIVGWSIVSGQIDWNRTSYAPYEGSCSMNLEGDIGRIGAVEQTITTVPGQTYDVVFYLAADPVGGPPTSPMRLSAAGTSATFTAVRTPTISYSRQTWRFTATGASTTLRFESLNSPAVGGFGPVVDAVEVRQVQQSAGLSPFDVSFYRGDPNAGGTLIGRTRTTRALGPGEFEDVSVTWNNPPAGLHPIVVVADDPAAVAETDETNNKAGANILLGIGPFPLVDGLLTRHKDTAVDLTWAPVPGAASYNLYRRATPTGAFQLVRSGLTAARYSDASLTNGTTYYYLVRWVGATGLESGDGTEASAIPTPDARAANTTPPTILSNPVTRARTLARYSYQVTAGDPDAGDTLTYTVAAGPAGMNMNPSTGLIEWTPTAQQFGYVNVTVRVEDRTGRFATQTYRLFVEAEIINNAPLITSTPITRGASGEPYGYRVTARDPDAGDLLTYSLTAAPAGMTINQSTGTISWLPTRVQVGTQTVTVRVTDLAGLSATQTFAVAVARGNKAPVFSSLPVTSTRAGSGYRYQPVATDPDADPLTFSLVGVVPATTMTVDTATGLVSWAVPASGAAPLYDITIRVVDDGGLAATQAFRVSVGPPNQAPVFTSTAITSATSNTLYRYAATATDPNLPNDALFFSLRSAPTGMTINGNTGLIEWMPPASAANTSPAISIEVKDIDGLTALQNFTLRVGPPDTTRPSVSFQTNLNGTTLTRDTAIVATVADDNLRLWRVEYRPVGSPEWLTLASGTTSVNNGQLAKIPATLWQNDVYRVRLYAEDGAGSITSPEIEVVVDTGQFKLGDFALSFEDLRIPGFTFPISVRRKYDTKRPQSGDFGLGWTLGYSEASVRLDVNKNALVTLPDGRRANFKYTPQCAALTFLGCLFPIYNSLYIAAPGVTDKLENLDCPQTFGAGANALCGFSPFEANLWRLTTKEGVKYTIDHGIVTRMEDRTGNWLEFSAAGLRSNVGADVPFERDSAGRIVRITEPAGASGPGGSLRYEYDSQGRLIRFTDIAGGVTTFSYENAAFPHYLTKIVDPSGRPALRNVFDSDGRMIAQCNADGDTVTLAGCTRYSPLPDDRTFTAINARGFKTELISDERGNITTERHYTDATRFLETRRTYDTSNNVLSERDPDGNTVTYTYDSKGNVLTETDSGSHTYRYTYDPVCERIATDTDPSGNTTRYSYDAQCNMRFSQDPRGKTTEYQYNAFGQLTKLIDANGGTSTWTYQRNGQLQSATDAFGKTTTYTFGPTGDLLNRTDRLGRQVSLQYDSAHRLLRETWGDGHVVQYTYDATGLMLTAADSDSRATMTYDALGRIRTVDNAGTPGVPRVLITYQYDANGNLIQVSDSLGGATNYTYDALDRLVSISQNGASVQTKSVGIEYDGASLARTLSRSAGGVPVASTAFEYECGGCAGRVRAIRHRKASDNSVIHDLTFSRNPAGTITGMTDLDGNHSYTYDPLGMLQAATHAASALQPNESYSFDGVGNRLSSHLSPTHRYSYQTQGQGNRLQQDNEFDFSYDAEGNLVQKTNRSTGAVTSYTFDYINRLIGVSERAGGREVSSATYVYDAANRRIRTIENGRTKSYVYEGQNPWLTFDSTGNLESRRLYNRGLDSILADEVAGQTRWYFTDHLGTVRDLRSTAGTSLGHFTYDSFGRLLGSSGTVDNEFRLTGREFSSATGLTFLRARYYDSQTGRFISEDPAGYVSGSLSLYDYAQNSPLSLFDPSGRTTFSEYSINARIAAFQEKAIECLGTAVFGAIGEAGVYLLFNASGLPIYPGGSSNVYAGQTKDFAVRFAQHGATKNFVETRSFAVAKEILDDPKKFRTLEQLLINAFGGKASLANKINASRKLFCN
ncbi:MAG: VCBS repeat-containing protein [Bryobacterales bacterium]|nr:VCBS repeat-containing protein [Bryobacterales bacterium]